jgi:hypothetical protein
MKGCTFKRLLPSGSITWGFSSDAGKDENGKRKRIFESGFSRKSDADTALRLKLNQQDEGELVKPDPTTFSAFILEWFKEHADRNCTPKTTERYRQLASYVLPHIGATKLQDLSALTIERVLNHLKDSGGWNRKAKAPRPLSAKTIRHIAGLVHVALDTAIRWKLIKANPVDGVQLPKVMKREARVLEAAQLAAFLDAVRDHGLYEFVMLAAATGCRRGAFSAGLVRRRLRGTLAESLQEPGANEGAATCEIHEERKPARDLAAGRRDRSASLAPWRAIRKPPIIQSGLSRRFEPRFFHARRRLPQARYHHRESLPTREESRPEGRQPADAPPQPRESATQRWRALAGRQQAPRPFQRVRHRDNLHALSKDEVAAAIWDKFAKAAKIS